MSDQRLAAEDVAPTSAGGIGRVGFSPSASTEAGGKRERMAARRWDWLFGSDPGLMRLKSACQAVLSIGLALAFGGLFVHLTGALEVAFPSGHVPISVTTVIHQERHGALVTAMLLGAVMAMAISLSSGTDRSLGREVVTALLTPVVMFAAIAACLPLATHRVPMFVVMVALAGIGTYLRRYGPRFAALGMLAWGGAFAAFFVHRTVSEGQVGWLAAELAIGAVVTVSVRVTVFLPRWRHELRLTSRSLMARQRTTLFLAAKHLQDPTPGSHAALEHKLIRLNETALMIDGRTAGGPEDHAELAARVTTRRSRPTCQYPGWSKSSQRCQQLICQTMSAKRWYLPYKPWPTTR